jgi:hypothetical protein
MESQASTWPNGHLTYVAPEHVAVATIAQYPGGMPAPGAYLGGAPTPAGAPAAVFDQNAPAAAADPNLKVLSPEQVQHELNA